MTRSALLAALVAAVLTACSAAPSSGSPGAATSPRTAASPEEGPTSPPTPGTRIRVAPLGAPPSFPAAASTATMTSSPGPQGRVFEDLSGQILEQAMAQGAVHVSASYLGGSLRLDGTVTRVEAPEGGGIIDWWLHGTVTRGTDVSEVLLYADLMNALAGVLWVRDAKGFDGKAWGRLDVTGLDLTDTAAVGRFQALAKEHPGLAFGVSTVSPALPWSAGHPWSRPTGAVASGPFREQHAGRPAVRFDLVEPGKAPCHLWTDEHGLPLEKTGCFDAGIDSATWTDYGVPGTGYVVPPAADTADVAALVS